MCGLPCPVGKGTFLSNLPPELRPQRDGLTDQQTRVYDGYLQILRHHSKSMVENVRTQYIVYCRTRELYSGIANETLKTGFYLFPNLYFEGVVKVEIHVARPPKDLPLELLSWNALSKTIMISLFPFCAHIFLMGNLQCNGWLRFLALRTCCVFGAGHLFTCRKKRPFATRATSMNICVAEDKHSSKASSNRNQSLSRCCGTWLFLIVESHQKVCIVYQECKRSNF